MPASDRWEGLISRLPDSSSVNRGSWTDPLAKTRSPAEGVGLGEAVKDCQENKQEAEANIFPRRRRPDFDGSKCAVMNAALFAHAPFCQVMAGRGAPEVSQWRMTDVPSITALSAGPAVMFGAIPARQARDKDKYEDAQNNQVRQM